MAKKKKGEESGEQLHGAKITPLLAGDDTTSLLGRF